MLCLGSVLGDRREKTDWQCECLREGVGTTWTTEIALGEKGTHWRQRDFVVYC